MSRKLWLGLALIVAVFAVGATVATAHTQTYNTEITDVDITFSGSSGRIEGRLASPRAGCERFRRVVAFAVDRDINGEVVDVTFIDAGISNENGVFVLQGPVPAGTDEIVIRVPRDVVGGSGHRHICRGDTDTTYY